LRRWGTLFCSC